MSRAMTARGSLIRQINLSRPKRSAAEMRKAARWSTPTAAASSSSPIRRASRTAMAEARCSLSRADHSPSSSASSPMPATLASASPAPPRWPSRSCARPPIKSASAFSRDAGLSSAPSPGSGATGDWRGGPGIGLRPAPRSPCRSVEDGAQAQGAPSVAKLSRCMTKRLQPDYRRYLRTGFPPRPLANARVSKCGGVPGVTTGPQRTRHSAEGRESTLPTCSRRRRTREFGARAGGTQWVLGHLRLRC